MYDSSTGRFITEDPTEFEGGDENLYRYCGNNSINRTDPTGLCEFGGSIGYSSNDWYKFGGSSLLNTLSNSPSISGYGYTPYVSNTSAIASMSDFGLSNIPGSYPVAGNVSSFALPSNSPAFSSPQYYPAPVIDYNAVAYEPAPAPLTVNREPRYFDYQQMYAVGDTFLNGSVSDSLQGASSQFVDAVGDLGMSVVNTFVRTEYKVLNTITGNDKHWNDLSLPKLSNLQPMFGNTQAFNNGKVVGDITARIETLAAAAYGAVTQLPAMIGGLYAYGSSALATMGIGGGGAAVMVPSVAGGVVTAAIPSAGIAATTYGAYNSGALNPLINWAMMSGKGGNEARLPPRGTPERNAIEAARSKGIRLRQEQELANIRAGGNGSGVWNNEELENIRATGKFPEDAVWHHDPTVANRPDLADDPASVNIMRGGTQVHLQEGHQGNWQNPK
jgi:hypothetical protein